MWVCKCVWVNRDWGLLSPDAMPARRFLLSVGHWPTGLPLFLWRALLWRPLSVQRWSVDKMFCAPITLRGWTSLYYLLSWLCAVLNHSTHTTLLIIIRHHLLILALIIWYYKWECTQLRAGVYDPCNEKPCKDTETCVPFGIQSAEFYCFWWQHARYCVTLSLNAYSVADDEQQAMKYKRQYE